MNLYAYCANNPVTYSDPSGYACSFNAQAEENAVRENTTLQSDEPSRTQGDVEGGNETGKTLLELWQNQGNEAATLKQNILAPRREITNLTRMGEM